MLQLKSMVISRFPAFESKDFKIFWVSGFLSGIGTNMMFVAQSWQVYSLTHSPVALGIMGLIRFLPLLIFSLFGGIAADSFNRKKMLFVTQLVYGSLSLILAVADFTNTISILTLYIVAFLFELTFAFDLPTRQAFFPSLVEKKYLPSAFSLNSVMFQSAMIVGPAIAGILISQTHLWLIYLIDAISYLFVVGGLILVKANGNIEEKNSQFSLASLKEGISFVVNRRLIWSTMMLDFFSTFFSSARALIPIFAADVLAVGPTGLGFLYGAEAVGSVIAGIVVAHFHHIRNEGKVLLISVAFYAIGTVIFGLSNVFLLSFIALMIVGASDSVSAIIRNTIRQIETPDNIRGRMTSVNMIFFMGGPQLGDFEAGALAGYIGAGKSVVVGGLATLAVVGIMAKKIPELLKYDRPAEVL